MRNRRDILGLAAAAGLTPAWARALTGPRQIHGFHPELSPGADQLMAWVRQLHKFGPIRPTGTPQMHAFEDWLEVQFKGLGFSVERIPYRLTSWECDVKDCSISVTEDGKAARDVEVLAYYPFCASTRGQPAATGRVLYAGVGEAAVKALVANTDARTLAESVVVMDMPMGLGIRADKPIRTYSKTFPDPLPPYPATPNVFSSGGRTAMEAVEGRVKALVLCYTNLSDEAGRYNYAPFSDPHRKTPALRVGKTSGDYLRSVAGKAVIALRCDAKLTPDARCDTLVATLPGPSEEVVFVTTETDGPNEINENGPLGVLALATHAVKAKDRRRTLVCSLPTGHYAMGAVMDPVTGSGKPAGTRGVMQARPEIMARTVGHLAMEQMGATDWRDDGGRWRATGGPAPAYWLPTAAVQARMIDLFFPCTVGEDPRFSQSLISLETFPPGEGGSTRNAGIPGWGLMGMPHYFFRADPNGVIDKFDPRIMKVQVDILTKLMVLLDRLTPDQLHGRAPVTAADLYA
ncbi:hypothetical protein [Phenylobacterium sp.]|uniref:hypothetical protein n=1 Tax=Phenylobacterium sp. TaxID=1871053 RepID=UPI0035669F6E